jgi:hypothetical protein
VEVNYESVEKLALIQCSEEEMAGFFELTLDEWNALKDSDEKLRMAIERGYQQGHMGLRRRQWKSAESGNTTMLIWLGKQYLGQSDQKVTRTTIDLSRLSLDELELLKDTFDEQS